MTKKQLAVLCIIQLACYIAGTCELIFMPVFATRLGGSPLEIGNILAVTFLGVALGWIVGGTLSDRWQHRKEILIVFGILHVIETLLLSRVTSVNALAVGLFLSALFVGIENSMVSFLAGLFAGEHERGRVFGLLGGMIALAGIIGGWISGPIVTRWDHPAIYVASALIGAIGPLAGLLAQDKVVPKRTAGPTAVRDFWKSRSFLLLWCAFCAGSAVNSFPGLARPLIMDRLHFDPSAIASPTIIGSIVSFPIPILLGWLSDRIGRKWLLVACFVGNALGVFLLIPATLLWHFWLELAVLNIYQAAGSLGPALVADTVPKSSLSSALAVFSTSGWIGLTIGSALAGLLTQEMGMSPALVAGTAVGLLAALAI